MDEMTETTPELNAALAKAQGMFKAAKHDRTNPHYKNEYSTLNAIREAIREPLSSNGLCFTQQTEYRGDRFVMVTTLRHESGQTIKSVRPIKVDLDAPQKMGSGETYARRYSLMALVGITAADADDDADDDAEAATETATETASNGNGASNTGEVINDQQANVIRELMKGKDYNKFLEWAKVESISDIYANDYDEVVAKLQAAVSAKKQATR